MAIFTFSTKGTKPQDEALVSEIKKYCDEKGINFSAIVVSNLRTWKAEHMNDGRD